MLETEYLKRPLIDGPAPEPPKRPIDHVGVQKHKNGLNAVGVAPIAGRVSGTILVEGRRRRRGGRFRTGSASRRTRSWSSSTSPTTRSTALVAASTRWACRRSRRTGARNLMACTGIEFCKLSFAETRRRAQVLVPELEKRLADINAQLDVPITVNLNGCPNSCARIQVADIGFKGQMIDDGDGNQVEGFQVHLGGSLGLDSGFGRKLRQHKVTSDRAGRLHRPGGAAVRETREEGERFAPWAVRADEADFDERARETSDDDDEPRCVRPSAVRPS